MRYGIDVDEPMSLSSISAAILGMSRDRTRNLERSALEAIRNSSVDLQGYLAG